MILFKNRWKRIFARKAPATVNSLLSQGAQAFLQEMPKAEIHVHFEGSITAQSIWLLAQKHHFSAIRRFQDAENCLDFNSPQQFFQHFLLASSLLKTPEDFFLAAKEIGKRYKEENIHYAEITIAPHKFIRAGTPYIELMKAMDAGLMEASPDTDFRYIIDVVRDLGPVLGMEMMRIAEQNPFSKVVGIGLGGSEIYPAQDSKEIYALGATLGLHKTAHAGEGKGPESIWDALCSLGAERIDHGVRSTEDSKLLEYLSAYRIPLNLCLSSNILLGVIPSLETYPLPLFLEKGIPITLSTDDPSFFKTSLSDELGIAIHYYKLKYIEIFNIIQNAIRASFMTELEKKQILTKFKKKMDILITKYHGALGEGFWQE